MILKSCYIENYGGLRDKRIEFSPTLTCFMRENGAGKTTLASFLRAMFYGLPSTKVGSVTFNDRERFYPFNGGRFGGSLSYDVDGKIYKIERFFDRKSSKKDSFKLYENGREISPIHDLGLEIFGVDEQTFSHTVFFDGGFLNQIDGKGLKLNDVVGETLNGSSYEDAVSTIQTWMKKYKTSRGDNGIIKDLREKKREADHRIENYITTQKSLEKSYEEKAEAEKDLSEVKCKYDNALNAKTVKAQRAFYESKVNEAEQTKTELYNTENAYPCSLPPKTEIEEFAKHLSELNRKKANTNPCQ